MTLTAAQRELLRQAVDRHARSKVKAHKDTMRRARLELARPATPNRKEGR